MLINIPLKASTFHLGRTFWFALKHFEFIAAFMLIMKYDFHSTFNHILIKISNQKYHWQTSNEFINQIDWTNQSILSRKYSLKSNDLISTNIRYIYMVT